MPSRQTALAAIAMLCLFGCQSKPHPAPTDPYGGPNYPKVNLMEDVKDKIVASSATVSQPGGKPIFVTVPVRNVTHDDLWIQYRFIFLNDRGMPVRPDSGWQDRFLGVSNQEFLEGGALDTSAVDWRLEIQRKR